MISPCIKVCRVVKKICIGCRRTIDEISQWSSYTDQQRHEVMKRLKNEQHSRS
jgi:predicted Fe-S protein YdhL (DUF1289 family)